MSYVGMILLYLAGGATVFSLITSIRSLNTKEGSYRNLITRADQLSVFGVGAAVSVLLIAFLSNNFSLAYVANHSARNLSLIYKISALWAGQSGSLLLWLLIISALGLVPARIKKYQENSLDIGLGIIINLVRLLFIFLLLFVTPPFGRLDYVPFNGSGLNPMLQSLGMVFHPPLLFIGFGGFIFPFALAVVGLLSNDQEAKWLTYMQKWLLFSWLFLTAGIITGGHWAYTELGWGGYWAWDPVENSSLFPWLTSMALLHILLLPNRHRFKKLWSYILVATTYILTIFATFLTRSGILDSVHAFAGGILGQIFFVVLLILILFSVSLGWIKRRLLIGEEEVESSSSVSGVLIVLSSILLLLLCVGVFLGTMFPLIMRALGLREVVLDEVFFNQLSAPLFLGIIFLMNLSPLFSAKKSIVKMFLPALIGLGTAVLIFLLTDAGWMASIAFALSVFGSLTHLPTLLRPKFNRCWGAAVVHLGVLVILVGVTASSVFVEDIFVSVEPGDEVVLGEYLLQYDGLKTRYGNDRYSVFTTLEVSKDGKPRGTLTSEKTFWEGRTQPSTKVGILSSPKGDIYLNLAGWEGTVAQLHLQQFALVSWIWVGSGIIYLGTLVILLRSKLVKQ